MKIKISADSTCDLPASLVKKHNIGVLPLYIIRNGEALKDGLEITTQDVFDYTRTTGQLCSTAAANIGDFIAAWTEYKKDSDAIIHISISSELSASYNNACVAAKEFGDVWVVDSRSLSSGSGLLALEAADMIERGMGAEEIVAELEKFVAKLDVSFVLDTLEYLRKGGRCSAVAALGANMLSLKPCIEVRNGAMGVGKKYRGNLEKCFQRYIQDRLQGREDIDTHRIFITDSGLPEETVNMLKDTVMECQPFDEVVHSQAGCTISSHCGPRCMGILYFHK